MKVRNLKNSNTKVPTKSKFAHKQFCQIINPFSIVPRLESQKFSLRSVNEEDEEEEENDLDIVDEIVSSSDESSSTTQSDLFAEERMVELEERIEKLEREVHSNVVISMGWVGVLKPVISVTPMKLSYAVR